MNNVNKYQPSSRPRKRARTNRYYVHVRNRKPVLSFRSALIGLMHVGIIGAIAVGCYFAGVQVYGYLTTDSYFNIQNITVENNVTVSDQEILDALGIHQGVNIFCLKLDQYIDQLISFPNIKSVQIRKKLPDQIIVRVYERSPLYQLYNGAYFYLDEDGVVLAKMTHQPDASLPVITGLDLPVIDFGAQLEDERLKLASKVITSYNSSKDLHDIPLELLDVSLTDQVVMITPDGGRISFGSEDFQYRFKKLDLILNDLRAQKALFATIDLRFENVPVVLK